MKNAFGSSKSALGILAIAGAILFPRICGGHAFDSRPPERAATVLFTQAFELDGAQAAAPHDAIATTIVEREIAVNEMVQQLLPTRWKSHAAQVSEAVLEASDRHDFDPVFILAVARHESRFSPSARGSHGEIGLMQVKPETAEWVLNAYGIEGWDLENPADNIRIGALVMSAMRDQFNGRAELYVAAYNMGAGNVRLRLSQNHKPRVYMGKILSQYNLLHQVSLATVLKERVSEAQPINVETSEFGRLLARAPALERATSKSWLTVGFIGRRGWKRQQSRRVSFSGRRQYFGSIG